MRADIFVTDDEPSIRGALVKRLTRQGHHAVGYDSGEARLAWLQHRLPDLVLLDLKMPGLSGLETLTHGRQLAHAAIVIMLTAYETVQDAVETMTLGTYNFMIKSVDLKGLDAVIARAPDVLKLRQRLADRTDKRRQAHAQGTRDLDDHHDRTCDGTYPERISRTRGRSGLYH